MEIYSFYQVIKTLLLMEPFRKSVDERLIPIYGLVGGLMLFACVFLLQGIGISKMAKNREIEKRWMAFVPFVNIWYLGKLSGDGQFFGQRMKRTGLYAMLGQFMATLATYAMIVSEAYLFYEYGAPKIVNDMFYWPGLTGVGQSVEQFYNNVSIFLVMIFQLICEVLFFILLTSLFKKYAPRNYTVLSILCLFVPLARFFTIFALRNRKAIDYDAYVRARREAYARQYQQTYNPYGQNPYGQNPYGQNPYGQNPYGQNPYGQNPYGQNPYGQNPYGQNGASQQNPEEPFEEFSSASSKKRGGPSDENSDGFFD